MIVNIFQNMNGVSSIITNKDFKATDLLKEKFAQIPPIGLDTIEAKFGEETGIGYNLNMKDDKKLFTNNGLWVVFGAGGSGKSALLQTLIASFKNEGLKYLAISLNEHNTATLAKEKVEEFATLADKIAFEWTQNEKKESVSFGEKLQNVRVLPQISINAIKNEVRSILSSYLKNRAILYSYDKNAKALEDLIKNLETNAQSKTASFNRQLQIAEIKVSLTELQTKIKNLKVLEDKLMQDLNLTNAQLDNMFEQFCDLAIVTNTYPVIKEIEVVRGSVSSLIDFLATTTINQINNTLTQLKKNNMYTIDSVSVRLSLSHYDSKDNSYLYKDICEVRFSDSVIDSKSMALLIAALSDVYDKDEEESEKNPKTYSPIFKITKTAKKGIKFGGTLLIGITVSSSYARNQSNSDKWLEFTDLVYKHIVSNISLKIYNNLINTIFFNNITKKYIMLRSIFNSLVSCGSSESVAKLKVKEYDTAINAGNSISEMICTKLLNDLTVITNEGNYKSFVDYSNLSFFDFIVHNLLMLNKDVLNEMIPALNCIIVDSLKYLYTSSIDSMYDYPALNFLSITQGDISKQAYCIFLEKNVRELRDEPAKPSGILPTQTKFMYNIDALMNANGIQMIAAVNPDSGSPLAIANTLQMIHNRTRGVLITSIFEESKQSLQDRAGLEGEECSSRVQVVMPYNKIAELTPDIAHVFTENKTGNYELNITKADHSLISSDEIIDSITKAYETKNKINK